jgi:hypothetical protein
MEELRAKAREQNRTEGDLLEEIVRSYLVLAPRQSNSLGADLAINCPAYACRQLGRNVEAGKRQAASNATRRRSIEDPAWTPDGAESLFALVTPARFRLLGRLFDPSPKFTGGRGSEFQ